MSLLTENHHYKLNLFLWSNFHRVNCAQNPPAYSCQLRSVPGRVSRAYLFTRVPREPAFSGASKVAMSVDQSQLIHQWSALTWTLLRKENIYGGSEARLCIHRDTTFDKLCIHVHRFSIVYWNKFLFQYTVYLDRVLKYKWEGFFVNAVITAAPVP